VEDVLACSKALTKYWSYGDEVTACIMLISLDDAVSYA
jgi:hypothetical protein